MALISIIFALLLFGGCGAVVAIFVYAAASKRFWIIPAAGGIVFFGLIALGLLGTLFFTGHRVATVQTPSLASNIVHQVGTVTRTTQGTSNLNANANGLNNTVFISGPNWSKILLLGVLVAFLIGLAIRRMISPACGYGLHRAGRVVVAIAVAVLLLLGTVGISYQRSQISRDVAEVAHETSIAMATQQRAVAAIQQRERERGRTEQLAQADIQAIEQFDAPRIPLHPDQTAPKEPEAPAASAPPAEPAEQPAAKPLDKPKAKSGKDDKKPPTASNHKRKKPDKTSTTGDTKDSQAIAQQSGPAEAAIVKKENTPATAKPAMVAEAESEKPKPRPAWVDEPPKRVGAGVQREVIVTDLWSTKEECEKKSDMLLMTKVYEHLQQLGLAPDLDLESALIVRPDGSFFDDQSRGFTHSPEYDQARRYLSGMGVTLAYARRETAKEEYLEKVDRFSVGPMLKLYTLVEFSPTVDRELQSRWENCHRRARFAIVGVGAGSILGLLGCVFALLKIDTATKGYYTKRLFLGVPLAIIVGIVLLIMIGLHPVISR